MTYHIKPCDGLITSFMSRGRKHPLAGVIRAHQGIDIGSSEDNRIWASASGRVHSTGYSEDSAGNYVLITHPNGQTTSYSHLSRVDVARGQRVSQGQRIGMKGATGAAKGVHLHFEIVNGPWTNSYNNKLNPLLYFVDPLTTKMQVVLKRLGYEVDVDGFYGEQMITAVALYQKRNGLTVDGYAGRGTYARIMAEDVKQVAGIQTPKPVEKEEVVALGNKIELEFDSGTLQEAVETLFGSKLQQELLIELVEQHGLSDIWKKRQEDFTLKNGDMLGLLVVTWLKASR